MVSRQLFSVVNDKSARHRGKILSIVAHVLVLLCFVGGFHTAPRIAPFRLRGTAKGVSLMTYYSPGSLRPTPSSTSHVKKLERTSPVASRHALSAPEPEKLQKTKTESGVGSSIESGLGEGDITIALATYFPHPTPDLSGLPHGTEGDVVLDAVIDEHGKIAHLTLLKGLGAPIDQAVIATVQQWCYTPAKKEGIPVPSEQELHFHYQRG
jgi:protein TonB